MVSPSGTVREYDPRVRPAGEEVSMRKVLISAVLGVALADAPGAAEAKKKDPLDKIGHIVVIYEENHSFDNLYGGWEKVDGVKGVAGTQVDQSGQPYQCLLQNDVNLTSPPLSIRCAN